MLRRSHTSSWRDARVTGQLCSVVATSTATRTIVPFAVRVKDLCLLLAFSNLQDSISLKYTSQAELDEKKAATKAKKDQPDFHNWIFRTVWLGNRTRHDWKILEFCFNSMIGRVTDFLRITRPVTALQVKQTPYGRVLTY